MRTDLFDFDLPESAIALHPVTPRDAAQLLVVRPRSQTQRELPPPLWGRAGEGGIAERQRDGFPLTPPHKGEGNPPQLEDRLVRDLPDLLRPGDALVFNDTRVIRAALQGERMRGEGSARISFNLHKRLDESRWRAFARPAKRLAVGDRIRFGDEGRVCLLGNLDASVTDIGEAGEVELSFSLHGAYLDEAIDTLGDPPLPPYIAGRREVAPEDAERYQTIYARREGAVAAPTAGLHFTPELMAALEARGISSHFVTLHVGAGTFLPVKADDTDGHRMHAEWGEITEETAAALNATRAAGGRIVAVGTTALRLLETAASFPSPLVGEGQGGGEPRSVVRPPTPIPPPTRGEGKQGPIRAFAGETDLFITPGYRFKAVDLLMTNFHLPRSTLFMLVAAFSGLDTMKAAYVHALQAGYRFYSYGDACLLLPAAPPP